MKIDITKIVCVFLACAFILAFSGCGASKGFTAKADTTWGELCREFDKTWFDSLSDEMKSQLDEMPVSKNYSEDEVSIKASTPVYKIVDGDKADHPEIPDYIAFDFDTEVMTAEDGNTAHTDLILNAVLKDTELEYAASASSTLPDYPVEAALVFAMSDAETGKYILVDTKTMSLTDSEDLIHEKVNNVEKNRKYKFQAVAIFDPPEGYEIGGPLYAQAEIDPTAPIEEENK